MVETMTPKCPFETKWPLDTIVTEGTQVCIDFRTFRLYTNRLFLLTWTLPSPSGKRDYNFELHTFDSHPVVTRFFYLICIKIPLKYLLFSLSGQSIMSERRLKSCQQFWRNINLMDGIKLTLSTDDFVYEALDLWSD